MTRTAKELATALRDEAEDSINVIPTGVWQLLREAADALDALSKSQNAKTPNRRPNPYDLSVGGNRIRKEGGS